MSDTADDPTLDVTRNLRAIVDLCGMLHEQAVARATHHDMPGGDATVMLGPVASPEAWENRAETAERLWWEADEQGPRPTVGVDEDANWEPPLQTLLFWSEAWRYEHDATTDLRPTIETEASWLRGIVAWAYDNEPHFADFEKDIAAARRRLEAVLYAGEREERSHVPCIDCVLDRDGQTITIRLARTYGVTGLEESWHCPRCRRKYDEAAFIRARHEHLTTAGADRFVLLPDAAEALGLSHQIVRTWIKREKVTAACQIATRRLVVWYPDVRAAHIRVMTYLTHP